MPRSTKKTPDDTSNVISFNPFDPEDVNKRLYMQVSALLTQLEERESRAKITMRERIAALIAVGRLQQVFAALRKANPHDPNRGSTVRKYATAFAPDAAGRRKAGGRSGERAESEPVDWFDRDDVAPDDAADDFDSDDAAE
ncbi:MAG TPA: hypothetical protein VGI22_27640 [Xanthobacteraceae bacterium]